MSEEEIITTFESIGIPKTQTKVYLDLVKNNSSTVTLIAKRTKMHRANVYDTLNKLKEKNLVYPTMKEGKKVFIALASDLILHEQQEKVEKTKSAIDYLKKLYESDTKTPKVYILEGLNALKNTLFSLLENEKPIWVYGLIEKEEIDKLLNERSLKAFNLERIKRKIELKYLFYNYPVDKLKDINKTKFTEARLLPRTPQARSYQISQIACGKKLYLTIWINPIYTIIIENEIIAQEYADFYSFIWNYCEEI